jgi:Ohr subfamily peroxiredoxin
MMTQLATERGTTAPVIYTAKVHTVGGRENGVARSSDGRLDVKFSLPGSPRIGTNPEQLLAVAWSASFESAIEFAARKRKTRLTEIVVDAEIDLHFADGAYSLSARLNVTLPDIDIDVAREIVEEAHQICPYSKATRGNVHVAINLI